VALPSELRSLELIGPSEGTARLEMAALEGPVVRVAPNSDVTMAFAAVDFQGGASAIEAMDLPAAAVRISLQGCAFAAQRGQAVRISGAGGGALRLDAANCRFTGSRGGIFAASPSAGRLDVDVSTSEFKDLASYGPGSFLGAGVDVYLEPGGDLGLRVDRCVFRSVASAVQLVESTDGPALLATPGNLRAVLSNNLIHGSSLPANTELGPGSVASGLYLSLWPHHQSASRHREQHILRDLSLSSSTRTTWRRSSTAASTSRGSLLRTTSAGGWERPRSLPARLSTLPAAARPKRSPGAAAK
jgi:hypothetical protein